MCMCGWKESMRAFFGSLKKPSVRTIVLGGTSRSSFGMLRMANDRTWYFGTTPFG